MSRGLFVTATGTDVGKTFVTALIIKKLREEGYSAGYYKAALSGVEKSEKGISESDAGYVKRIAGLDTAIDDLVGSVYENAVSPHLAAQIEGNPVEMDEVKAGYRNALSKYDYVTMEGSGGIMCPIRYDDKTHIFLEDIIRELDLPVIVVADAGLGTINAVVLTIEYMWHRNMQVKGIIFNHFHPGNVMEEDNKKMVEAITGIPVIAFVKENDSEIDIPAATLAGLYE